MRRRVENGLRDCDGSDVSGDRVTPYSWSSVRRERKEAGRCADCNVPIKRFLRCLSCRRRQTEALARRKAVAQVAP